MRFFIPGQLVEFEYLGGGHEEASEPIAEEYIKAMDFAFFAVHLHYTKADYNQLTHLERALIMKAWENKTVLESTLTRNAVQNAYVNARRKKGKKALPLFKKKPKKADQKEQQAYLAVVTEHNKNAGTTWVDMIYSANGLQREG